MLKAGGMRTYPLLSSGSIATLADFFFRARCISAGAATLLLFSLTFLPPCTPCLRG